jgi:hypothetical protein
MSLNAESEYQRGPLDHHASDVAETVDLALTVENPDAGRADGECAAGVRAREDGLMALLDNLRRAAELLPLGAMPTLSHEARRAAIGGDDLWQGVGIRESLRSTAIVEVLRQLEDDLVIRRVGDTLDALAMGNAVRTTDRAGLSCDPTRILSFRRSACMVDCTMDRESVVRLHVVVRRGHPEGSPHIVFANAPG